MRRRTHENVSGTHKGEVILMRMNEIAKKAIFVLQSMYSLGNLNRKLVPLNKEFETDVAFEYFHLPDYYPEIYEDTICKIIELAVLLRREKECLEKYGDKINKKVKYSNVGKNVETNMDIAFDDALSKIIHAKNICLQVKDTEGVIDYTCYSDANCCFTGVLRITVEEKNHLTISTIDIDLEKFCIDALMINARTTL